MSIRFKNGRKTIQVDTPTPQLSTLSEEIRALSSLIRSDAEAGNPENNEYSPILLQLEEALTLFYTKLQSIERQLKNIEANEKEKPSNTGPTSFKIILLSTLIGLILSQFAIYIYFNLMTWIDRIGI